jgi:hypothetical protein
MSRNTKWRSVVCGFVGAACGHFVLYASPAIAQTVKEFVLKLQTHSPGTTQPGNVHLAGTLAAGKIVARSTSASQPAGAFSNSQELSQVEIGSALGTLLANGDVMKDYGFGPVRATPVAFGCVAYNKFALEGSGNFDVIQDSSATTRVVLNGFVLDPKCIIIASPIYNVFGSGARYMVVRNISNTLYFDPYRLDGVSTRSAFVFAVFQTN